MTKYLFDDNTSPDGMVSISQITTWNKCRRAWMYSYGDCMAPAVEKPYLSIGRMCHEGFHAALEYMWSCDNCTLFDDSRETNIGKMLNVGKLRIQDMWDEYMSTFGEFADGEGGLISESIVSEDLLSDALSVFDQALREFNPLQYEVLTVVNSGKNIPALELHFCIPCAGSKGMHGYIDSILIDRNNNQMWCVDYKFRSQLSPDEEESFNIQNAVYTRACSKMGIPIAGTMTWQHSNKPACEPSLTKAGMSRAKIRTTWEKYCDCLVANGMNPDDYFEMEEKLANIEWFRETKEIRSDENLDLIWDQIIVPSSWEIKTALTQYNRNYKKRMIPAMFPWNCKLCSYSELCQSDLRGYDSDYIRDTQFVTRKHRG